MFRLPVSSSIENLSRQLLTEKNKAREERLHRSLSLPRRTKNQVDVHSLFQNHPPATNTSMNDPVLMALQSRRPKNRSDSVSPTDTQNSSVNSGELDDRFQSRTGLGTGTGAGFGDIDAQSINSHNPIRDSLLDLAEGLGGSDDHTDGDNEQFIIQNLDSSPGQRHRSNSLPEISLGDMISAANDDESPITNKRDRIQSTDDTKFQSRKLLLSWVKEQKKRYVFF